MSSPDAPFIGPLDQVVLVTDLDRTFTTMDLQLDPAALAAVTRLRQAGATCVLATGRSLRHVDGLPELTRAFDGLIVEGGSLWGDGRRLHMAAGVEVVQECARDLESLGARVRRRTASFSVGRDWEPEVRRRRCSVQPNVDAVDVLPPGVDKGIGLRRWLAATGRERCHVVAIGDAENDVPLLQQADVRIAVANAVPAARKAAHWTTAGVGSTGFLEAAHRLLRE